MNKTWTLTRILLKNGTPLGGNPKKSAVLAVVLLLALTPLAFMIGTLTSIMYGSAAAIQQESLVLGLGIAVASMVVFVFGIVYVVNVFYFTQDVAQLLPLPLAPSQILAAKFAVTVIYEYLTQLIILLPVLVAYGASSGAGPLYYLYAAFVFLTLPILPLAIASFIAMIVMRLTSIGRNKGLYRMIGGTVAVFVGIGGNLLFQRLFGGSMTPEQLQELILAGNQSLFGRVTLLFPSAKLAALALLHASGWQGLVHLLGFAALTAVSYLAVAWVGELFYFRIVMSMSETSARRERLDADRFDRRTAPRSVLGSYFRKEMTLLVRTPVYFLNCVLMTFLWPVLFCLPFLTQSGNAAFVRQAGANLERPETSGIALATGFALLLLAAGGNNTSPTAISREGKTFFLNKHLPVPYAKMLMAKLLPGLLLGLVTSLLLALAAVVVLDAPLPFTLLLLAAGTTGIGCLNLTGLLLDLRFPKLNWDSEQKVVKQNWNVLLNMLISLALGGVCVFLAFRFQPDAKTAALALFAVFGAADLALYRLLLTEGARRMAAVEP